MFRCVCLVLFDAMFMCSMLGLADRPPLVPTYACLVLCVFDAVCMCFLYGFADKPPLVARDAGFQVLFFVFFHDVCMNCLTC